VEGLAADWSTYRPLQSNLRTPSKFDYQQQSAKSTLTNSTDKVFFLPYWCVNIIIIIIIIIITDLYSTFMSEDTEALDAAQED